MKNLERIALKIQTFEIWKNKKFVRELLYLFVLFVILVLIFKIAFYKESLYNISVTVLSLFWLGLLPGYSLLLSYLDKLSFVERVIIGTALGYAFLGVVSYNLGMLGLHLKIHHVIVPILGIIIGLLIFHFKGTKK